MSYLAVGGLKRGGDHPGLSSQRTARRLWHLGIPSIIPREGAHEYSYALGCGGVEGASELLAEYHWSILVSDCKGSLGVGRGKGQPVTAQGECVPCIQHGEQRVCVVLTLSASFTILGKFHSV